MTRTFTNPMAFDATLNGREVAIEFDRVSTFSAGMEGQDADGNRGVWTTTLNDDRAEHITITRWYDGPDGPREETTPIAALSSLDALEVQRLIDDYLDTHAPQEPEDDEPDYDDDRGERADE